MDRRINADLIDWALLGNPPRQGYRPPLVEALQPVLVVNPASEIQAVQYITYDLTHISGALLAAGATEQVFAPGTNVNGAIIWKIEAYTSGAASKEVALLAKAGAAPASTVDGDPILMISNPTAGVIGAINRLPQPILIQAGKGLWFRNDGTLESAGRRSVLYSLL